MVTQGTILEINGREATVTAVSIYTSKMDGEMQARVEYTWNDTNEADSSVGSVLISAIADGSVIVK